MFKGNNKDTRTKPKVTHDFGAIRLSLLSTYFTLTLNINYQLRCVTVEHSQNGNLLTINVPIIIQNPLNCFAEQIDFYMKGTLGINFLIIVIPIFFLIFSGHPRYHHQTLLNQLLHGVCELFCLGWRFYCLGLLRVSKLIGLFQNHISKTFC